MSPVSKSPPIAERLAKLARSARPGGSSSPEPPAGSATDLSGHESDLGSRDKPMQLKRTQSFRQLIR